MSYAMFHIQNAPRLTQCPFAINVDIEVWIRGRFESTVYFLLYLKVLHFILKVSLWFQINNGNICIVHYFCSIKDAQYIAIY